MPECPRGKQPTTGPHTVPSDGASSLVEGLVDKKVSGHAFHVQICYLIIGRVCPQLDQLSIVGLVVMVAAPFVATTPVIAGIEK